MAFKTNRVQASGVRSVVFDADYVSATHSKALRIKNIDTVGIAYIGGSDVSILNGYPLNPGEEVTVQLTDADPLHCISPTTANLAILSDRH